MRLGKQYDEWHQRVSFDPDHADARSPWYKLVLEHIGSVGGLRILEVACGRGGFAGLLASRGAVMFGVDFSEKALQIAQAKSNGTPHIHVNLAQADAENLPFSDESFDVIVSCETIEHLPDPANALKEMARVCCAGGTLYLTTPNYLNAMGLYYIYARLRGRRATPGADQPLDRVFVFPEVRSLLKHAGWKIINTDGTIHQFPIRPGHNPLIVAALEANRTIRRFLSPLAFHYFAMARRSDSS